MRHQRHLPRHRRERRLLERQLHDVELGWHVHRRLLQLDLHDAARREPHPTVASGDSTDVCLRWRPAWQPTGVNTATVPQPRPALESPQRHRQDDRSHEGLAARRRDGNDPDVQSYYTTALNTAIGTAAYSVWDLNADPNLPQGYLTAHKHVVWFTGNTYPAPISRTRRLRRSSTRGQLLIPAGHPRPGRRDDAVRPRLPARHVGRQRDPERHRDRARHLGSREPGHRRADRDRDGADRPHRPRRHIRGPDHPERHRSGCVHGRLVEHRRAVLRRHLQGRLPRLPDGGVRIGGPEGRPRTRVKTFFGPQRVAQHAPGPAIRRPRAFAPFSGTCVCDSPVRASVRLGARRSRRRRPPCPATRGPRSRPRRPRRRGRSSRRRPRHVRGRCKATCLPTDEPCDPPQTGSAYVLFSRPARPTVTIRVSGGSFACTPPAP